MKKFGSFIFLLYICNKKILIIMKTCEKERAIACLKLAIELAGDGGMTPFTDKEYDLMYKFIEELENDNK